MNRPESRNSDRRGAILIVIDGCRADALSKASAPHIGSLLKQGAFTFAATTVNPPATLPVHFSIFSSLPPEGHGVIENGTRPVPLPGVVTVTEMVKNSGGRTCAFFNWEPLRDLAPAGCLDHLLFMSNLGECGGDLEIAAAAATHIALTVPDFAFVYLGNADIAGHDHGFMSKGYLSAIQTADTAVGLILKTLDGHGLTGHYNIVLQSDHGGVDHSHHDPLPEVVTIPWIASGPDVRAGIRISSPVTVLDTGPTLARFLGIAGHESWQGRVVEEAFRK